MSSVTDVTYQTVYLVLTNVLSTSFLMFHITFDEISTTLYNCGKGKCALYMWSNDMFVLWSRISAIFDKDRKYCLHIFPKQHALVINGLIFDIMSIQNNQSLEFE